ncbi:MAG: 4-(cytidine 5'-diphospho)-2-C-methyl-D-erythritol kinase [Kangiella sp.]|nr:MAG: 4-(cytidine 5'-diphospho)-2-C-methyl-D-erythritol kinase [Kangiella sp.]
MSNSALSQSDLSKTIFPCPAKLNLFLQFIGQREDGYHLLQSYFQLLDFGDELEIEITQNPNSNSSSEINFTCNQSELESNSNLVIKAAKLLQEKQKIQLGANIHLIKNLPVGGGVGGGSSDCATALVALNHLWSIGLSIDELAQLGESLGADVPFFIRGRSAFVEGIGEIITPMEVKSAYFLVIQPNCTISTNEIFSNPLLTRNSKAITIRDLETLRLPFEGFNRMQNIVCESSPLVSDALKWLKSHNKNARMTGSGSSLFAVFDNQEEAGKIASLSDPSWLTFVARGIASSPLHAIVKDMIL